MPLPGKLAIGFLQEDNPAKAYFRFRALLIKEADGWAPLDVSVDNLYPEDGSIRIVPDKNEIGHFRMRMYQLGRYCALDLRRYPGQNEKIRINKNYTGNGIERNAFIVYSDVIVPIPGETLAEVLDTAALPEADTAMLNADLPGTPYVALRCENRLCGPWTWTAREGGGIALRRADDHAPVLLEGERVQSAVWKLNLDARRSVCLMDGRALGLNDRCAEPVAPEPEPAEAPAAEAIAAEPPAEASPPRAVAQRISVRDLLRRGQPGINPLRRRSLHEVIDEKWRHSRYEQLGCPVPGEAMGRPVVSPVEHAVAAVHAAWEVYDARDALVNELTGNEEMRDALCRRLKIGSASETPRDPQAERLEAERLRLLGEIDAMRIRRADAKEQLLNELRAENQAELDQWKRRRQCAQDDLEQSRRAAQDAREAAEAARQLMQQTDEALDCRLLESVAVSRARTLLLRSAAPVSAPAVQPTLYEPAAGELISDVRVQLQAAGFPLDNDQAVNLLLCLATGGVTLISGPSGAGKTDLMRALAAALGLTEANRRLIWSRETAPAGIDQLLSAHNAESPGLMVCDDFNRRGQDDDCAQLIALQERLHISRAPVRVAAIVLDPPDGRPLTARLLGRSFLVRLEVPDLEWQSPQRRWPDPGRVPALNSLRIIFRWDDGPHPEVRVRMQAIRENLRALGWRVDPGTLEDLWRYLSAAARLMACGPIETLDWALSQRLLPVLLASLDLKALARLPEIFEGLPRCQWMMNQSLPLPPIQPQ